VEDEEEEVIEEEVVDEAPQEQAPPKPKTTGRTWQPPASKPLRQGPPPMVSLVDKPRPQSAPPPNEPPPASNARKSWGAPKAVPAKDAAAAEKVEKKSNFLGVEKKQNQTATPAAEAAPAEQAPAAAAAAEPKQQRRWNPLAKRQPEKFKKTATEVREQGTKKTTRLAPLPFTPRKYPTVAPSGSGKETAIEKMLGPHLYRNAKLQKMSVTSAMADQELVCLYFGAAWRPGCKAFHQNLIDFYKLTSKDENLEIIYVSVDKTIFEFKEIFARFPFLAMPTGTTTLKNALTKQLGITELPVFVVFEVATGNVVTVNGVEEISELASRDKQAAINLVQQWKNKASTPLSSFKATKKMKVGENKGNLIWQN
jgi:thiol-disulfide isomerase/thioredoxin